MLPVVPDLTMLVVGIRIDSRNFLAPDHTPRTALQVLKFLSVAPLRKWRP